MIQNRTMTVFSTQPASSKWWWIGAMLNTRLRVALKTPTWMMTEIVSMTNRPPSTMSSSSVRVTIAMPANAPPIASEPVSPMKILAGEAFHHRKPKQAPIAAAATSAMSSGSRAVVAGREVGLQHAGVAELPEADDDVRREDHERRSRRPGRRGRR